MPQNNENQITPFGITTFRNQARRFGIKTDDRRRHMYFIGKTGMGKSTILENMIVEDIRAGRGVAVVDPHGDLAEKIIEYIPTSRTNDVIYFNPSDMDYPIAFNVVEQVDPHLRHLVASGLIGVFQKLWADSWGPRLEYILRNAILAILDYPGSTLLGVTRMLSDKKFRKKVVDKIQDPVVKAFWVNEFASYADKFASEAVSPIQNKVGQFLSSSLIRNIVGQVKSSINIREVMDEQKILILNLSKGRIGEDNSALLGAMMITKIQLAAMSRVEIPEKERKDFYLYIDEFQNFTTDSFANILSEARKYRLNLIMAHQYIEQLGLKVKPAVFGNVGTLVVFRVGSADAEELVKEFSPTFTEEDIVNLPKYEFYIKLMIDGITSNPFSGRGLPPLSAAEKTGNMEKVIKVSRERYAKDRTVVEEKIMRWHENDDEKDEREKTIPASGLSIDAGRVERSMNRPKAIRRPAEGARDGRPGKPRREERPASARPPEAAREARSDAGQFVRSEIAAPSRSEADNIYPHTRHTADINATLSGDYNAKRLSDAAVPATGVGVYRYDAWCSRCGKQTKVSFKPDGARPVYCKDCLSILREEKNRETEERRKAKQAELKRLSEEPQPAEAAKPDEGYISLKDLARSKQQLVLPGGGQAPKTTEPAKENNKIKSEGELKPGQEVIFD